MPIAAIVQGLALPGMDCEIAAASAMTEYLVADGQRQIGFVTAPEACRQPRRASADFFQLVTGTPFFSIPSGSSKAISLSIQVTLPARSITNEAVHAASNLSR
ncbi:hypothetical protein [Novosphingobium sp. PP1Y]|uniref:hypothetical protein n=1 Tax=Novosphingobium sp. PP1Y TaxID=702113 RepID=UPI0011D1EAB1|nr:hypothetical protein [Novosphingobium sp. PP1Y]